MATSLFTLIDTELSASGVADALEQGIDRLGSAQSLLEDVSAGPSAAVAQMSAALQALSIPELDTLKALVDDLQSLTKRIPDPSELTGGLEQGVGGLLGTLENELVGPLSTAIDSIKAAAALVPAQPASQVTSLGVAAVQAAAAQSPVVDALGDIDKLLDEFPSPLTVEGFLVFLNNLLKTLPPGLLPTPALPVIGEFQQRLETVLAWRDMDGPALATAIRVTLESVARFINTSILTDAIAVAEAAEEMAPLVPVDTLRQPMLAIEAGLQQLGEAVTAGNAASIGTRVGQLNTQVSQVNARLATLGTQVLDGQSDRLVARLSSMPVVLDNRMREMLAVLKPPRDLNPPDPFGDVLGDVFKQADADELLGNVEQVIGGLQNLVDAANLQAIREPLLDVANGAQSIVSEVDDSIIDVTTRIQLLFDDVTQIVEQLDVQAVTASITLALTSLRDLIRDTVTSLFAPVAAAVTAAVETLSDAVSAVGVEDVVDAVRDVIERFGDILGDPQVVAALGAASKALDEAAAALKAISFSSVTDEVVADIGKVTAALQKIDPNALPDALRGQLKSAVAVLPTDFDPIVKTISDQFDELMESGPKPFLATIQDKPDLLATRIQDFSPEKLVGDKLAGPYSSLIEELADFRPSQLLTPVQDALDGVAERLEAMNPGKLLEPVESLHADLLNGFSKLDPAELIAPVAEQFSSVIDLVVGAVPANDLLDALDPVLGFVQTLVDRLDAVRSVLQKLTDLLHGLTSPEQQVQQLLAPIVTRIGQLADSAALSPAFDQIREAVTAVNGSSLQNVLLTPLDTLQARLNDLDPSRLHAAVVRAYRDFPRAAVDGLPTPQRTQVQAFLDAFDPRTPVFSRPFSTLQTWRGQIDEQRAALVAFFPTWDALYHRPDGPLSEFVRDGIATDELRDMLEETLTSAFAGPMKLVFGLLDRIGGFVRGIVTAIGGFVDHVQSQLADLLLVPQAFTAISDALQDLVGTLQGLDLSFLADEAKPVFTAVRGQLEALDPTQIRAAVEAAFAELVGALKLDKLLPAGTLKQLDQTYEHVLDTLRGIDPTKLIVDVVQPEFEEAIEPLLEVILSLSELIKVLVERLDSLSDELTQGLSKTGDAFEKMVAAIPT